jgi:hypothetical protein
MQTLTTNSPTVGKRHTSHQSAPNRNSQPNTVVLQLRASKASFKNASVRALSILSPAEVRELVTCEEIISQGWETFVNVGRALAAIRDKRLYRADFETFEAYCRRKWQYGKSHAYRLIGAAEVIASLSPIGDIPLPRNEAQVRPLLGLRADEVQAIWREAVKKAGKKNVTAKLVNQAVARFRLPADIAPMNSKAPPNTEQVKRTIALADKILQRAKQQVEAGDFARAAAALNQLRNVFSMASR